MAKKLKPKQGGYDAAEARADRAKLVYRISVKDSDLSFVFRPSLPISVRGEVTRQTGQNADLLLHANGTVDLFSYVDMWWISRLCDDELGADGRPVTRRAVQDEFDARFPGASLADIEDVDISGEIHDSPEA